MSYPISSVLNPMFPPQILVIFQCMLVYRMCKTTKKVEEVHTGVRKWLLGFVESPVLTKIASSFQYLCGIRQQTPHIMPLHYFFSILTMLGSEEAYGTMLPLLVWLGGGTISRETMFCWMLLFAGFACCCFLFLFVHTE